MAHYDYMTQTDQLSARLALLFAGVLVLAGCSAEFNGKEAKAGADKKGEKARKEKAVLVELAEVKRGMIESILERSAPLEAEAQVEVAARTSNPAIELLVEEGDTVDKDQVLLRLESDKQKNDHDQAKSQLDKEQVDFDRQESLYKDNLISDQEYRNAKFSLTQRRLAFEEAKRQFEYTEVRAPIKGTITLRDVKVGDQVGSGRKIFEIIDFDSTVAIIHVPEQYLPKLRPGMEARLISNTLGDRVFAGYVKRISPIVEARAGTIKVTVGLKELGALRPGMWVDVELVLETKQDALLIPKKSIVYDNDQTFAYKLHTGTNGVKRVKRRLVLPLNTDKVHIEPSEGFEPGEKVVIAGQSGLKENSRIREQGDPDPDAEPSADTTASTNAPATSKSGT
ncbi:MAG: efflux RND transporter periplasmic adaptor subunit [Verrucomicrobiota bacterium]|nr:efflux RND transporter periplasmic adaptor subunit [Verrucomicrobiota bacterium]